MKFVFNLSYKSTNYKITVRVQQKPSQTKRPLQFSGRHGTGVLHLGTVKVVTQYDR